MKNVCLIIRDGFDANYIVSELKRKTDEYNIGVILEKGGNAKKKKLKRMIDQSNIFAVGINLLLLLCYDKIMTLKMAKSCGGRHIRKEDIIACVDDINDKECEEAVRLFSPDVILVYGTAIIKKKTMNLFGVDIYNLHSSILPYYRNVHSDFWAYMDNRFDLIGITLIKLNEGIDTGNIVMQVRCDLPTEARLCQYKIRNLEIVPILIKSFLGKYYSADISPTPQDEGAGTSSYTPSTKDLLRFFKRERTRL